MLWYDRVFRGYESYHIEIVKAKESISYSLSEDLKVVEKMQIGSSEEAVIYTWTDEDRKKGYYAYIVKDATIITIGTGADLGKLRKVLLMLSVG